MGCAKRGLVFCFCGSFVVGAYEESAVLKVQTIEGS